MCDRMHHRLVVGRRQESKYPAGKRKGKRNKQKKKKKQRGSTIEQGAWIQSQGSKASKVEQGFNLTRYESTHVARNILSCSELDA